MQSRFIVQVVLAVLISLPLIMLFSTIATYRRDISPRTSQLVNSICLSTLSAVSSALLLTRNLETSEVTAIR